MFLGFYLLDHLGDRALLIDQKGGAHGAHVLLAVVLLQLPGTEEFVNTVIRIGN